MLLRSKPFGAVPTLVLYAGMLLPGLALHLVLGCEHDLVVAGHDCDCDHQGPEERFPGPAIDQPHHGHPADCPVCQFHSQGQLAASPTMADLR